jgi:hypothetical protein
MAMPRDDQQKDLLCPALEEIVDMDELTAQIDWQFLGRRFGPVYADDSASLAGGERRRR